MLVFLSQYFSCKRAYERISYITDITWPSLGKQNIQAKKSTNKHKLVYNKWLKVGKKGKFS